MSTKLPRPMPEGYRNRNIESFLGWPGILRDGMVWYDMVWYGMGWVGAGVMTQGDPKKS